MNLTRVNIGVYVCHCGTNIASTVDVEEVAHYAASLDGVKLARHYTYMCSDPGQDLIKQDIREHGLNRVLVASCSPLMHEPTFRRACDEAGLNPFFFQMANIREHFTGFVAAGESSSPEPISPADRVIPLFNGKDLTGWYTWLKGTGRGDPNHVFSVKDGAIRVSGEGSGYIATKVPYKDYPLGVEYKWGTKTDASGTLRNASVLLNATGRDGVPMASG